MVGYRDVWILKWGNTQGYRLDPSWYYGGSTYLQFNVYTRSIYSFARSTLCTGNVCFQLPLRVITSAFSGNRRQTLSVLKAIHKSPD